MANATVDMLADGTYFAEIKGLSGVWGSGSDLEHSLTALRLALKDWLPAIADAADENILILPSDEDDEMVSGPLLERILHNSGISIEEWERAGREIDDTEL
jgi:hypothetical protein